MIGSVTTLHPVYKTNFVLLGQEFFTKLVYMHNLGGGGGGWNVGVAAKYNV
jgi:hypothetical protein